MRLWSLHPAYLDAKGLVALWREALLAKKVLGGRTRGYRRHPQLARFKSCDRPVQAIDSYLEAVFKEAKSRGFNFNPELFSPAGLQERIPVTEGQLRFELEHLLSKLKSRDHRQYSRLKEIPQVQPHPLFSVVPGPIEPWEKL